MSQPVKAALKIELDLEKKGLAIGKMDELIVAVCLFHNAAIVTRS